ncbi:MAG TPA: DNA polymerase Y family protein [Pirellulales bacterium]|nr:DNA polymerase Y family protein [Pirellulales bacterium]
MKPAHSSKRYLCLWFPEGPHEQRRGNESGGARTSTGSDREAIEKLARWCQQFSPYVAIEPTGRKERGEQQNDPSAHDALLLEIAGSAHLFGGEAALAQQLARRLANRSLAVGIAVADTIGAAWALARREAKTLRTDRTEAGARRAATGEIVAAGQIVAEGQIVAPGKPLLAALGPLPLAALRLAAPTISSLASLGIDNIAQLSALPRDQLTARFGPSLLRRLDQATGQCEEVLELFDHQAPTSATWMLEFPTDRIDLLQEICCRLAVQITDTLSARGEVPLGLTCQLGLHSLGPQNIPLHLYRACPDPGHLACLIRLHLERHTIRDAVCSVRLVVTDTARREAHQKQWFDTHRDVVGQKRNNPSPHALSRWIERLSSRLGHTAVARPELRCDPIPERASRLRPLTRAKRGGTTGRQIDPATFRFRPLWLEPVPLPLHKIVLDRVGRPLQFEYQGQTQEVSLSAGPERIESTWRGRSGIRQIFRDYYRVETAGRQRFWLFRRHGDGVWFLHGEFD